MPEKSGLKLLEAFHDLIAMSDATSKMLDNAESCDDYSDVSVETWHKTIKIAKITIETLRDVLKTQVEYNLQIQDSLQEIVAKIDQK